MAAAASAARRIQRCRGALRSLAALDLADCRFPISRPSCQNGRRSIANSAKLAPPRRDSQGVQLPELLHLAGKHATWHCGNGQPANVDGKAIAPAWLTARTSHVEPS